MQKTMNGGKKTLLEHESKIYADIRLLTENLLKAYAHCITITDSEERQSTMKILRHLKEDFEGYFASYIDRRESVREYSTFLDMIRYYGIEIPTELVEYLQ